MNAAKYYIYRNLRTGGFSIRYRGRVIDRLYTFSAYNVDFKISELGRQRVIKERQKNVHAFVVCDKYKAKKYPAVKVDNLEQVTYNPYTAAYFVCNGLRIDIAEELTFQNGQCFLIK